MMMMTNDKRKRGIVDLLPWVKEGVEVEDCTRTIEESWSRKLPRLVSDASNELHAHSEPLCDWQRRVLRAMRERRGRREW